MCSNPHSSGGSRSAIAPGPPHLTSLSAPPSTSQPLLPRAQLAILLLPFRANHLPKSCLDLLPPFPVEPSPIRPTRWVHAPRQQHRHRLAPTSSTCLSLAFPSLYGGAHHLPDLAGCPGSVEDLFSLSSTGTPPVADDAGPPFNSDLSRELQIHVANSVLDTIPGCLVSVSTYLNCTQYPPHNHPAPPTLHVKTFSPWLLSLLQPSCGHISHFMHSGLIFSHLDLCTGLCIISLLCLCPIIIPNT